MLLARLPPSQRALATCHYLQRAAQQHAAAASTTAPAAAAQLQAPQQPKQEPKQAQAVGLDALLAALLVPDQEGSGSNIGPTGNAGALLQAFRACDVASCGHEQGTYSVLSGHVVGLGMALTSS
jgi:hypothetical protein